MVYDLDFYSQVCNYSLLNRASSLEGFQPRSPKINVTSHKIIKGFFKKMCVTGIENFLFCDFSVYLLFQGQKKYLTKEIIWKAQMTSSTNGEKSPVDTAAF